MGAIGSLFSGAPTPQTYTPNQGNFNLPNYGQLQSELGRQLGYINNQQAPQSQAAVNNGVAVAPTQLGAVTNANAAQVAPTAMANGATLGPAAMAQGVGLGGQANQYAGQQQQLANQLQSQLYGGGPAQQLTQLQLQNATNQNLNSALALGQSLGGNNGALQRQQLAQNFSNTQQQAANQSAQLTAQNEMNAQTQLANQLATARGQNISVAGQNAQLAQNTQLANQGAANQFGLQQGQFNQAANLQNAAAANQNQQLQAQLAQQTNLTNAGAANTANLQQGQFNYGTNTLAAQLAAQAAQQNAGNQQQTNLANAGNQLSEQQLIDQARAQNVGQQLQTGATQLGGQEAYAGAQQGAINAANQAQLAQYNANVGTIGSLAGAAGSLLTGMGTAGLLGGGGLTPMGAGTSPWLAQMYGTADMATPAINAIPQVLPQPYAPYSYSDKDIKENIDDGSEDVDAFLDSIAPVNFNYLADDKPHTGVIAQDLEKSDAGKRLVFDTPLGKVIGGPDALGMILAAQASLHTRLKQMEKAR